MQLWNHKKLKMHKSCSCNNLLIILFYKNSLFSFCRSSPKIWYIFIDDDAMPILLKTKKQIPWFISKTLFSRVSFLFLFLSEPSPAAAQTSSKPEKELLELSLSHVHNPGEKVWPKSKV